MKMTHKIKNLTNQEEWIILDLKNMKHQVRLFLKEVDSCKTSEKLDQSKLTWYEEVFRYYLADLIPALEESAEMEDRHMALLKKNPDEGFSLITKEVEYHQALYIEFSNRFETIYREFHEFIHH